jgi:hypothetical protein
MDSNTIQASVEYLWPSYYYIDLSLSYIKKYTNYLLAFV